MLRASAHMHCTDKEGPLHAVQWHPGGAHFVLVYGHVPSTVALFNSRCEPIFDFGTGARNYIQFDRFGQLLAIAGFGNIRGRAELWDIGSLVGPAAQQQHGARFAPPQLFTVLDVSDDTDFGFAPDGLHFYTGVTHAHLRVNNKYERLFLYSLQTSAWTANIVAHLVD